MKYNIIDLIPENITNPKLKEIVNEKLYRIIEFMKLSINDYE